jgi:site-specific DNA-methyltransferase (adenine-specific)
VTVPVNQIICGDNVETLRTLPDACVDSCVTDPPYGIEFMGKAWDRGVPGVELWREVLRVLKPGGHLLAFAGTRTQHRMATAIEDAGFEIRDMIAWVYGSGFPKSLDVSKAIDKAAGAEREVVGRTVTPFRVDNAATRGTSLQGSVNGDFSKQTEDGYRYTEVTAPATEAAKQWAGWGTALKPSLEPITVARKPLCGTVAENVLQHGTGGLNVDGCRVPGPPSGLKPYTRVVEQRQSQAANHRDVTFTDHSLGRWPANLIHDGSDEVVGLFPEDGEASAARFFYCAKADKADRGPGNNHPTVKPVDLMRYLVRLVCPIGGVVLDPFSGSGTTLAAAQAEGCLAIGVEREAAYCEIIKGRFHQRRLF